MGGYDFKNLSAYDFQLLLQDLLQEEWGVPLESFAPGRDQGIDLRWLKPRAEPEPGGFWVVQCKHYARSGYSRLLSSLREEVPKVRHLNPDRYIVATSVSLTPGRKDEIYKLFPEWMSAPSDVIGAEDLHRLLRRFPPVEQRHFKLWLTSAAVLERLLHSDVVARSEGLLEDIDRKVLIYVQSAGFPKAKELLERNHVCVISGVPGIGKTTLAEMLLVDYVQKGFQVVAASNDVLEIERLSRPGAKQLFYYDDFLGQTSLAEKLNKNEDLRLVGLIDRVRRDPDKRLILTTREYILKQAKMFYERLETSEIDVHKYVLTLEDYGFLDKAHILYNHLYFSSLSAAALGTILEDKKYMRIIIHENYSPRIIEYVVASSERDVFEDTRFADYFLENLNNPERLWSHAVDHQLDLVDRYLLLTLATLPRQVELETLYEAARPYLLEQGVDLTDDAFRRALRRLEGTFIGIRTEEGDTWITLSNPSVRDFLVSYLAIHEGELDRLIHSSAIFEQLEGLWRLATSKLDEEDPHIALVRALETRLPWLLDGLRRTAESTPLDHAAAAQVAYQRPGGTRLVERTRLVLEVSLRLDDFDPEWIEHTLAQLGHLWSTGRPPKPDTIELLKLLETLPSDVRTPTLREAEEKAVDYVFQGLTSVSDCTLAQIIVDERPDLVSEDEKERLSQDFFELFEEEIATLDVDSLEDVEDGSAYLDATRRLRDAADAFGLISHDILEKVEEIAGAIEEAEYEWGYDEDDYARTGRSETSDVEIVQSLFDSLTDGRD
jgi:hypothetical protein